MTEKKDAPWVDAAASREYLERLGMAYKMQRQMRHIPQGEVAARVGCRSTNTISAFELGSSQVSVYQLKLLCEAIGVSYIKLLDRVESGEDML